MLATISIIIAISTLGLALILFMTGQFNIISLAILMAIFNLAQWLLAPKLINILYKTQILTPEENPTLNQIVEELSIKSGIKKPKLMLANLPIPNAFAYGSPLTGNHVAVTNGLLDNLNTGEIEAVIGHELGHIKHRDVQVMMFISFLPSLFYIIARSTLFTRYYGGRDRKNSGSTVLIGGAAMFIYFILLIFNLSLSRLREYYADQHSSKIVQNGASKLSSGLAKITISTSAITAKSAVPSSNSYKALFISDPDKALQDTSQLINSGLMSSDDIVNKIMNRRLTRLEKLGELFSTHPNIIKRLRALNRSAV
jgi:heat shock protein HtpX